LFPDCWLKNKGATILAEWIESNPMLESLDVCRIQFHLLFFVSPSSSTKKKKMKTHTLLFFFSFISTKGNEIEAEGMKEIVARLEGCPSLKLWDM
jgi:hypothetical protein